MKRFILIMMAGLFLNVSMAQAQDKANLQDLLPEGMEIIKPRYISSNLLTNMWKALEIRPERFTGVGNEIYVRFASAADSERAKRILERLDVPPKRIGVQLHFVVANTSTEASVGNPVDQKLLAQLKKVFRFDDYRVLSSGYVVVDSGRDGEMSVKGLPVNDRDTALYNIQFEPKFIDDGKGVIKLEDFEIERDLGHTGKLNGMTILETTLNIKNGDTVIVGSTNVADQVYITIVTASVVE